MKNFVIPSIDLLDGQIVRLKQGNYNQKTVYDIDIDRILEQYMHFSNLHIVDLNGARGDGMKNYSLVCKIREVFPGKIQLGGGIRTKEIARDILGTGIDSIVLGSVAINNTQLTKDIISEFEQDKIILALDCRFEDGMWKPKSDGWTHSAEIDVFSLLECYNNLIKAILVTDIAKDGMMQGVNLDLYKAIKLKFPEFTLQASGGVASYSDLLELKNITDFAIVGKALYSGLINEICLQEE